MARLTTPLTNTQVERAKPKDKDYSLMDGKGLFLRVKTNGIKSWLFNYYKPYTTPPKRTNLGIGIYPQISLAQARIIRDEWLALLAQNIDPKDYRESIQLQKESEIKHTFRTVAEDWFNTKYKPTVIKETAEKNWARFEKHIFPKIGNMSVFHIRPKYLVDELLKPIDAEGKNDTLFRLIGLINKVLDHAVNTGILESNSCYKVGKAFTQRPNEHLPTIPPEELPQFLAALHNSNRDMVTKILVQWLLLTMVRSAEAVSVEWSEIDWVSKVWNIPKEKMKGRKDEKRPHDVPLSSQSLQLLVKMQQISGHKKYVFPHYSDPNKTMSKQTPNNAIKKLDNGKYAGLLVGHGLRSIASTYLHDIFTEEPQVVEACLSHISGDTTKNAYYRGNYFDRRRTVMQAWGDFVEQCSTQSTLAK